MSIRIIASIESAEGRASTISVTGRVVALDIPATDPATVVALRCGPAHARRLAEALLLAARVADAGTA